MNPEYIEVNAHVRYWEDAAINGVEDINGDLVPFRNGEAWRPIIRLSDGLVMNWPADTIASIHYKVCDQGEYWLLDSECNRIAKYRGDYVPDRFLCHGDTGFGDYIIFTVSVTGVIDKWHAPEIDWERWPAIGERAA